ncbi:MAG TPA: Hsp70 family protein, partial [Acidimicrobiales bacterium]|nr:Hsp70 family protein [Acidimicrobiales bacterium]
MPYHLGVDVGTTWTAAAVGRHGRVEAAGLGTRRLAVPSVVCLTDERLIVGEAAARRALTEPPRVAREFKRRVGDPTPLLLGGSPVAAELCMARMVEWVVAQVAATEGEPPATLALTHPANWGEYKLDLYRQALRHVDLEADRFVAEPVAAATAYAAQRPLAPGTAVAVYDLGGGTFDAAVVRQDEASAEIVGRPDGIERMGGTDFDHAVFDHVLTCLELDLGALLDDPHLATGLARLREACVEAKEALSDDTSVSIPVMLPQRHTEVLLTRREFEGMIAPAVEETVVALRRAVASARLGDEGVAAVLLVGGSSRIPLVGQLVTARLQRPIAIDARPKDAISVGAAHVAMAAAATAPAPTPAPVPVAAHAPAPGP